MLSKFVFVIALVFAATVNATEQGPITIDNGDAPFMPGTGSYPYGPNMVNYFEIDSISVFKVWNTSQNQLGYVDSKRFDIQICIVDSENKPQTNEDFVVEFNNEVTTKKTNRKGCLYLSQEVKFNPYSNYGYKKLSLEISSKDSKLQYYPIPEDAKESDYTMKGMTVDVPVYLSIKDGDIIDGRDITVPDSHLVP